MAYFNSDGNGRGYFRAEGSHSLENFVNDVAKDIDDPETGMSGVEARAAGGYLAGQGQGRADEIRSRADLRIPALGSGSDYTVFIDHLGVASVNLGYGGEDEEAGSITPSTTISTGTRTFQDTDFSYGRALAQTAGTMMMRMADADVLPFQFADLADTVHLYVTQLKTLADREARRGQGARPGDCRRRVQGAAGSEEDAGAAAGGSDSAVSQLRAVGSGVGRSDGCRAGLRSRPSRRRAATRLMELNADLIRSERVLTDERGLPNRPWFEHLLYAPGFYTGYGVKTIPGVREAIEQKKWTEADEQIGRAAAALEREVDLLKQATKLLGSSASQ